jgi:hypothetical protein
MLLNNAINSIHCAIGSDRNLGARSDGIATKIVYENYPGLAELLLKLLNAPKVAIDEPETHNQRPESKTIEDLYLAFELLDRVGPPESYRNQIMAQIMHHIGSQSWHTRKIAAKLYSILLREDWMIVVEGLLKSNPTSTNLCHGIMLTVRYAVKRHRYLGLWGKQLIIVPARFIPLVGNRILLIIRRKPW